MLRMHTYPSGHTGLAAFCDVCGDQITEHGYVVWCEDQDGQIEDWRVIHQARCDVDTRYSMSMGLDNEIVYLARSANIDLHEAEQNTRMLDMIG